MYLSVVLGCHILGLTRRPGFISLAKRPYKRRTGLGSRSKAADSNAYVAQKNRPKATPWVSLDTMQEHKDAEEMKEAERRSLIFKGPTVVAALVCFVAALFAVGLGLVVFTVPSDLQGTFFVNLSNGNPVSRGLLELIGVVLVILGGGYVLSGALLWSKAHWIKGVYVGIMVSIVGMLASGLATTFAPGLAASGLVLNILIVTLVATETWEESRGKE